MFATRRGCFILILTITALATGRAQSQPPLGTPRLLALQQQNALQQQQTTVQTALQQTTILAATASRATSMAGTTSTTSGTPGTTGTSGTTGPPPALNFWQQQNALQAALQQSMVLAQTSSRQNPALSQAARRQMGTLQAVLQQSVALQSALQMQNGTLTPGQVQMLSQQQARLTDLLTLPLSSAPRSTPRRSSPARFDGSSGSFRQQRKTQAKGETTMFRKALSFAGMLLLVGAAVLVTPGFSQARGGGHGGGGHFGGGHIGGAHIGGAHIGGIHYGGYHGGIYHGGNYYGGYHSGYPYGHDGYRHFYPYSSYYPYYVSYNYYYPYSGYSGLYDYGASPYSSTNPDTSALVTPQAGTSQYQSFYPPTTTDTNAHVTVKVPADAQLWFEGKATTSTGAVREFESPPLAPGRRYSYEVRARWNENGHEITQTQKVAVTAGARVNVEFPERSGTAAPAAAK
jgi:uncharacterized protein (TIGR03000 family)